MKARIAALGLLLLATPASAEDLRILHIADMHSRYDEVTASGSACTPKDRSAGKCVAGAARLQTKLRELRTPNSLFLDAGDEFQGSLLFTWHKQAAVEAVLSRLRPDAQGLGNHEFDEGPAALARYVAAVPWPVLSANLDASDDHMLNGKTRPYTVLERNGRRIAVIALTTAESPLISKPGPNLRFAEEISTLRTMVAQVRAQGIDRIIVLTHLGYSVDQQLPAEVDGIDVVVGGHSHTLLGVEGGSGPYPTVVKTPSGAPALIVHAGPYGLHLGQLDVSFDDAGVLTHWSGRMVPVGADVPQDREVAALIAKLSEPLASLRGQVVGRLTEAADGNADNCRSGECSLGSLLADAMLWATQRQGTQLTLLNGGAIRTSLPQGEITMGQVLEVLPFSNMVVVTDLTGEQLLAALEHGASRAHDPSGSGTGRFLQVAGLRYAFDASQPEGKRLKSAELLAPGGAVRPVDPQAVYRVATSNFLRAGGDGFAMIKAAQPVYDDGPNAEKVLADYLAQEPRKPTIDGRVRRLDRP